MSRYAVVCDGQVINVCLWEGDKGWQPEPGCTVHKLPDDSPVGPGWTRAGNGRFVAPKDVQTVSPVVALTVAPQAVAALVEAVQQPYADVRQALADFASALNADSA